ncbi:hypothetical protein ACHAXT_011159 [Thalassiosira profunda]
MAPSSQSGRRLGGGLSGGGNRGGASIGGDSAGIACLSSRERLESKMDAREDDGDGWNDGCDDARGSQEVRFSRYGEWDDGCEQGGERDGEENASSEGEQSAREPRYDQQHDSEDDASDAWMHETETIRSDREYSEWIEEQCRDEIDAEEREKENRGARIVTSRKDCRGRFDESSYYDGSYDGYQSDLHERQQNEFGLTGRSPLGQGNASGNDVGGARSPLRERYGNASHYSYDDNGEVQEHGNGNHAERALERVDYEQIQQPQSMPFGEEEEVYDGDDEYQHAEPEEPPREIFVQDREEDEYLGSEDTSFRNEAANDSQQYGAGASLVDGNSAMEEEAPRRHTARNASEPMFHTSDSLEVIQRIESVMEVIFQQLDRKEEPVLRGYVRPASPFDDDEDSQESVVDALVNLAQTSGDPKFNRSFGNIAQCRSFASICMVLSFVHGLLLSNRTTTTREVFYVFVTHFRNQKECDGVILDVAKVLGVSRRSLGLSASPKGWFCGCVQITRRGTLPSGKDVSGSIDGTALSSIQGLPITREWTERDEKGCTDDGVEIKVSSKDARAILVIEKEGVYNRLSEERIFDRFPCILVTGKGFPDLATRALVSALHRELDLPVVGLCDCNPYGVSVLALYHCAGDRMGVDGRRRYSVPMQWLGLRPSEVAQLKDRMPETVFQKLTDLDKKRIASLLDQEDGFLTEDDEEEVRAMEDAGYKCELEALYWLSPDYMGNWVTKMLKE